jgi:hypothetical protein
MTESVIRAIFAQYGKVEHVHVFGGLDPVLTHVVFETKQEAANAFGELHGRNIYDGCCQLDIQWCSSQDPTNTNLAFSCGDNMVPIAAAKPATSVIGQDIFPNTNNFVEVANISPTRDAIKERKCELALLENEHLCADKRANSFETTIELREPC